MMRRLLAAIGGLLLATSLAAAQVAYIAPNAPNGDSSDRIANTKFVQGALSGGATPVNPNIVFAGPTSGAATAPGFRTLVPADLSSALATPPAIGGTTPAAGTFTTLTANVGGDLQGSLPNPTLANAADGDLLANTSGNSAHPVPTTSSAFFDYVCSSTVGQLWVRLTAAWGCSSLGYINPVWWGADPTGVADSLSAFNSAFAASKNVFVPAGTFKFSAAPTLPAAAFTLRCSSWQATTLETNFATGDFLTLANAGSKISDCGFNSLVTRTSGSYITDTGGNQNLQNLYMLAAYIGILADGTLTNIDNAIIRNLTPLATASGGAAIQVGDASHAPVSVTINSLQVDNPNASQPSYGVHVVNSDDLKIANSGIIHSGADLQVDPTTGETVASLTVINTDFDTSNSPGININPSGTANVLRVRFSNSWASSHTGNGITIDNAGSGLLKSIIFDDMHIFGNGDKGILINNASVDSVIIANSQIAGNTGAGIQIAGNASNVIIHGNQIGAYAGFSGNAFGGIYISATGLNHAQILDNQLAGNTSFAISNGSGAITTNRIADNDGYNPVGATAAASVPASPGTVCAGPSPETHYLKQTATNTATVTIGGQQVTTLANASTYYPVQLGPNECYVITWATTTPTDTKFVH